jgi:membrane-bound lytic murein transglycosylase B
MLSIDQQAQAIINAGRRYSVPYPVLAGVYGVETNYGYGTGTGRTSSAGAVGPFQFMPGTASQYGYPLTNTPTLAQFQNQANAAASYLSKHHSSSKGSDWTDAVASYNPGDPGYASAVAAAAQKIPSALSSSLKNAETSAQTPSPGFSLGGVGGAVSGTVGGISASDVGGAITGVFNQAIGDAKYAAVLLVVIVAAGFMIVHGVTGATPASIARRGAPE